MAARMWRVWAEGLDGGAVALVPNRANPAGDFGPTHRSESAPAAVDVTVRLRGCEHELAEFFWGNLGPGSDYQFVTTR